jgi:ATP-dependent RNA helicase SUPV3L1/SUV3
VVDSRGQARLAAALQCWLDTHLRARLGPLFRSRDRAADAALASPARGILFQLVEAVGCVPRGQVDTLVRQCDGRARKQLAGLGIRLGTESVYVDGLHGAGVRRLRAVLDGIHRRDAGAEIAVRARAVARGAPSIARDHALPDTFYRACGLIALGPRALVCPRAEALAAETRRLARQGAFSATPALRRLAGGSIEDLVGVLLALGFRSKEGPAGIGFAAASASRAHRHRVRPAVGKGSKGNADAAVARAKAKPGRPRHAQRQATDSPFAVLGTLRLGPRRGGPR